MHPTIARNEDRINSNWNRIIRILPEYLLRKECYVEKSNQCVFLNRMKRLLRKYTIFVKFLPLEKTFRIKQSHRVYNALKRGSWRTTELNSSRIIPFWLALWIRQDGAVGSIFDGNNNAVDWTGKSSRVLRRWMSSLSTVDYGVKGKRSEEDARRMQMPKNQQPRMLAADFSCFLSSSLWNRGNSYHFRR